MRYVIAIICAIVAGLIVATQFAPDMANAMIKSSKFQSPDQVDDYEAILKISIPLLAAAAAFLVGWLIGGFFDSTPKPTRANKRQ